MLGLALQLATLEVVESLTPCPSPIGEGSK